MRRFFQLITGLALILSACNAFGVEIIDTQGNVIYFTHDISLFEESWHVYKIDGKTGSILWKTSMPTPTGPAIFLDKKNNIILAGKYEFPYLRKYSGATGQMIWEIDLQDVYMLDTQLDKNGNPIISAYLEGARQVIKFDGVTGKKIWSQEIEY